RCGGEGQPPVLRHGAAGNEQEEGFAGRPTLESGKRGERRLVRRRAESVHRFGRIGQEAPTREVLGHRSAGRRDIGTGSKGKNHRWCAAAHASARARSSAVVTLKLTAESETSWTGSPRPSTSIASSVASAACPVP